MKTIENIRKKSPQWMVLLLTGTILFTSCLEEEDPFVDLVAAPVLLVFEGVPGYLASGGLTAIPSRTFTVTPATFPNPITLSVRAFKLDKSGILDHTIGIDSIPVVNMAVVFRKRDGTVLANLTTDENGRVTTTKTWPELGIPSYASVTGASTIVPLSWTGAYEDQTFTRYSQVQFSK